jgi:hypothetical protein
MADLIVLRRPASSHFGARAGPKGATLQIHGVGPSGMTTLEPVKK